MPIESYRHVDYTCFIHFEKSQKMKALGQKKCCKNSEPPNLELYPLIHFILPSIQKLSNFQVSYHFGKLLSSWFQNFCLFCNIVTKEHFTDHFGKLFSSWFQNFCPFCNILTEGHFTDQWTKKKTFFFITLYTYT